MICCLNPFCRKPINLESAKTCRGCSGSLVSALRGRYRPIQPLGHGGFGRTYLAHDLDRLNTRCVIKQFSPQATGTYSIRKAAELFNQEAIRLHELGEHMQIPALLAYFEQDSYLYLVQQYIDGISLAQELNRNGPFSESQIRQVLLDILPILQFVHTHQVIHRDITPTNILRRRADNRLILIDFGVAKQLRLSSGNQPGTQIGTEGYSPIEQLRGGQAYPASDLYSLGATCIHLLTNVRPEQLFDPLRGEWMWPDRLAGQRRQVSPQLAAVLNRLLQDLVRDRYQSAKAVWQDLCQTKLRASKLRSPLSNASRVLTSTSDLATPGPARSAPIHVRREPPKPLSSKLAPASPASSPSKSSSPSSPPPASASRSPAMPPPPPHRSVPPSPNTMRWQRHCLEGHDSWITCLAMHPTTSLAASGGLDDVIRLWDLRTGRLLHSLSGHVKGVNALAFSPDGRWLVSGSDDFSIKLWDPIQGRLVDTLMGHIRDVTALAISPNSEFLVSGSKDRTIRVWSLMTRRLLKVPFGVGSMIRAIAVSPDGSIFVSGGIDRRIKLWSFQTAELIQVWVAHEGAVDSVAISPDSQTIASAGKSCGVKLWDRTTGALKLVLQEHTDDVNAAVFSPNGAYLIGGSSDRKIYIWDVATGQLLKMLSDHTDSVNALAVSQDGTCLISGSADKTVRVWHLNAPQLTPIDRS
ncbi:MAG: serine/threonine-protein kinase [Elainellaceae cyanobacterium]